jgi:poly-gamma-glutamate synthesis protein (capsule biosynthesis protein)
MGKILLISDVCIQDDINIDKNLEKIIQEEVEFSICNLEGYFSIKKNLSDSLGISLKDFKKFAKTMKIKAVSIANNHINDGGILSREETFRILNSLNIQYFGTKEKPYLKIEKNSKKNIIFFAGAWRFVGSNLKGLSVFWFQLKSLIRKMKKYSSHNNFIIWFPHWGIDMEILPHPWQIKVAKEIIEAGVDVIYGNHSHLVQPLDFYENKPVVFCGGNFIMPWNKITNYYSKKAFNGQSLLLDIDNRTSEIINTYFNFKEKRLVFLKKEDFEKRDFLLNYKNEDKYLEYFKKNRTKILLPIYGYNNVLNYIKSIYSLLIMKAFSFKIISKIWKKIKKIK